MKGEESLDVIENIVNQLKPVKTLWSAEKRALFWVFSHALWICLLMYWWQPFRPDLLVDLSQPRFLIEVIVFVLSLFLSGYFSFLSLVPGALKAWQLRLVILPLAGLLVLLLLGIRTPFQSGSNLGMRSHCDLEILLYSILPLVHVFFLAGKGFFTNKVWSLFCASLASVLIPAFAMHFACMYEEKHILLAHIGPVVVVSLVGTALMYILFKEQ